MNIKVTIQKLILTALLMFNISPVLAAGPITHAYLAEKWIHYRERFDVEESGTFMRGTLFPDIRYLGVISRNETHLKNVSLKDLVQDKNLFSKGKKLHSFIDEEREKMVVQWNIYEKLKNIPGQKYISTFLKLLEDEILFSKSNWANVKKSLKIVDNHEKSSKISIENLVKWHQLLGKSFSVSPSKNLELLSKRDKYLFNIPPKVVRRWNKILPKLAKDPEIQDYVSNLITHFDIVFKKT
jgi:lipopolysaccharide export LptBFGC system permease protein LptF